MERSVIPLKGPRSVQCRAKGGGGGGRWKEMRDLNQRSNFKEHCCKGRLFEKHFVSATMAGLRGDALHFLLMFLP